MARSRILNPNFFRSRSLSRCSRDARLTFVGLWSEADDAGRGKADPWILKGSLWPLDADITAEVIVEHLLELAREHIVVYVVDGEPCYAILSWEKHQPAAYRRGDPKHPDPKSDRCTILHADECREVLSFGFSSSSSCVDKAAAPIGPVDATVPVEASPAADAFDEAVNAALDHRRQQADNITSPARWERAARNGITNDYGKKIRSLLDQGHQPADAGLIAVGAIPAFQPARQVTSSSQHPASCECAGTGWIYPDSDAGNFDKVVKCPHAAVISIGVAS